MQYAWNARKAASNEAKHGVSFEEAITVFRDPLSVTIDDPLHSVGEDRYVTMGLSRAGRLLVVVHADDRAVERIRIISARAASRTERQAYEQGE